MLAWLLALASVAAVSLVSLVGALTLSIEPHRLRRVAHHLMALAVGGLLGDALLHLIPESLARFGDAATGLLVIGGMLGFFVIERLLRREGLHQRLHHLRPVVAINLVGDGLHNAIDGMLIGASYLTSPTLGLGTTLAVLLHELPQELGDFGVMVRSDVPPRRALRYNVLVSLTALGGAVVGLALGAGVTGFAAALVPITAGGFLYLAGSDLVPELLDEPAEPRAIASQVGLVATGVVVMAALGWLE